MYIQFTFAQNMNKFMNDHSLNTFRHNTASVSESQCSNVSPALMVNSVSSGLVSSALGPDVEVYVRAPDDPVVCVRPRNSDTLRDLGRLSALSLQS